MRVFHFRSLALATAAMAVCAAGGNIMASGSPSAQALEADARVHSGARTVDDGTGTRLTIASVPSSPWLYLSGLVGLAVIGYRRR